MVPASDVIKAPYRVIYGDIDSMGVVYYGNYFRFFERGRAEYIRQKGMSYRAIEEAGFLLPVTQAHCHYHAPAQYDDQVLIETRVDQIKRASVRFAYEIYKDETRQERLVDGWTLHACVTPEKKIVRLPGFLLDMITG